MALRPERAAIGCLRIHAITSIERTLRKGWILTMQKPALGNLLVSVLAVAISIIACELVVRYMGLATPLAYLPNAEFGWSHTPNDSYVQRFDSYSIDVKTNSLGLRDYDYPYEKPAGHHRTLVLGDSFPEAKQVSLDNSIAKLLERDLNQDPPESGVKYEVINAGTSGYGTDNALLFYRHEGFKYQADVVLLTVYLGNDIRNNWYPLENADAGGFRKPYFVPHDGGLELKAYPFEAHQSLGTRIKVFLNRNFHLYSLFRETRNRLRNRSAAPEQSTGAIEQSVSLDSFLFARHYTEDWNTAWQVTKSLILALRDEVAANGARLLVTLVPTQFQVNDGDWVRFLQQSSDMRAQDWDADKPNKLLQSFLTDNDVGFVDLLPKFRQSARQTGDDYYIQQDGHWNEAGHALAAEIIGEKLIVRER